MIFFATHQAPIILNHGIPISNDRAIIARIVLYNLIKKLIIPKLYQSCPCYFGRHIELVKFYGSTVQTWTTLMCHEVDVYSSAESINAANANDLCCPSLKNMSFSFSWLSFHTHFPPCMLQEIDKSMVHQLCIVQHTSMRC